MRAHSAHAWVRSSSACTASTHVCTDHSLESAVRPVCLVTVVITAGCRREKKREEETVPSSTLWPVLSVHTQCFFSAALVSSAQCVHAHAQRPEYYSRSSACNSCNRVTKPRKTQKKRLLPCHFDLCLTETVCTSCSHGLPAYREQVAGVRGCRPKTGGYAVAAGPADGN